MKLLLFNIGLLTILFSCKKQDNTHAASGIFESDEMIVAAEVNGKIIKSLNEGSSVKVGDTLSIIDAIPLQLQKNQLTASLAALSSKTNKSKPQKDLIQQQKKEEINKLTDMANNDQLLLKIRAEQTQLAEVKYQEGIITITEFTDAVENELQSKILAAQHSIQSELAIHQLHLLYGKKLTDNKN